MKVNAESIDWQTVQPSCKRLFERRLANRRPCKANRPRLTEMSCHFQVRVVECDHKPQSGWGTPRVTGREGLTEVPICRPQSENRFRKKFLSPYWVAHFVRRHCRIDRTSEWTFEKLS